ncbi:MAG: trigger factor [Bacteroidaceae bacterium]|nr:trigger factor [Bacteroidaceae bacterium]
MNVQFDKKSPVVGELTITIGKADYQERVEKALKDYRKKANMPGFRPGQVPMSLLRKRFGSEVTAEEVQKLLSEKLYDYIREEKIDMLGEPLASDKQQAVDFEAENIDFIFDIAIAPEFDATLTAKDKIPYYTIQVTDDMVDKQVQAYAQRNGHYDKVDTWQEGDMTKGIIAELDEEGNVKEGGIQVEDAVILPGYFKDDEQKKVFEDVKVNTVVTFNPAKAYNDSDVELASLLHISKEEAAGVRGDFSYQITEITRYVPSELTQELFDNIFGEGKVKSEEEFRKAITDQLTEQFAADAQFRFMFDVRQYLEKRIGTLEWPDELLKRIMLANNRDKGEQYVEENYEGSIHELGWHLIKNKLVEQTGIKIEQDDLLEMAKEQTRMQFAQYGMANVPDELITNYATEQLKKREQVDALIERATEKKLGIALKETVKLTKKDITMEDFQKLFENK